MRNRDGTAYYITQTQHSISICRPKHFSRVFILMHSYCIDAHIYIYMQIKNDQYAIDIGWVIDEGWIDHDRTARVLINISMKRLGFAAKCAIIIMQGIYMHAVT